MPKKSKTTFQGFSAERLDKIRGWAASYIDAGKLPCCVTAIMRHGELVFTDYQGFQDVDSKTPICEDSLFRIFSMTKAVTSVAAMMLYEDGLFQLDDPVSKYIPELESMSVIKDGEEDISQLEDTKSPVTIKQLLTHTSGFTYTFNDPDSPLCGAYEKFDINFNPKGKPLKEWITDLSKLPLYHQPGARWNYSVSTDVLGHVIEVISGLSLAEFFEQKILNPLGMKDTAFDVQESDIPRLTTLYKYKMGDRLAVMDVPEESVFKASATRYQGGGGLISTASDYLRFQQMLMNKGEFEGVRLLGRKTVEFMTCNHLGGDLASMGQPKFGESNFDGVGFGLGFSIVIDPTQTQLMSSKGEYSWGGAASTAFWNDPEEEICVVFLTQLFPSDTYPLRRELRILVNQALID